MNTVTILGTTIVAACLTIAACDRKNDQDSTGRTTSQSTSPSGTPSTTTGNNPTRTPSDSTTPSRTPADTSTGTAETKIAAEVHRVIMEDKTMSASAQSCKVSVDKAGVVTLSGTVASQAEKDAIETKAKAIAGVTRVVNELQVQTK